MYLPSFALDRKKCHSSSQQIIVRKICSGGVSAKKLNNYIKNTCRKPKGILGTRVNKTITIENQLVQETPKKIY
jgi:hypothetical protein